MSAAKHRVNFINRAFMRYLVNWVDRKFPGVPFMSLDQLERRLGAPKEAKNTLLVDCRAKREFEVSRIEGAVHLDFESKEEKIKEVFKEHIKVAYRSSVLTERILKAGDSLHAKKLPPVFSLRESIFQWASDGRRMVDADGKETDKVHPITRFYGMSVPMSRWKF